MMFPWAKTSKFLYNEYIALNKMHLYSLELLSGTFCQVSEVTGIEGDHLT